MSVSVGLVGANVVAAAITIDAAKAMAPAVSVNAGADAELVEMCRRRVRFCRAHDRLIDRAMDIESVDEERYDLLNSIAERIHDRRMAPLAQSIAAGCLMGRRSG